ncbi:hypothetical protein BN946_scf184907.g9 [Trametes cinnabarina]|uniref:Fungal-type protein kinase domain-containing protein n=1 Tax=Pycnoporus cinnabarinus TaxID=5643 RepID=A0A060T0F9_PYCCI|nr:hypothetical protein BN946_scf184907.g9 [Trametes cinnabarina]
MSNNSSNAGLDRFPTPSTPPGYRTPPPRTPSPRADTSHVLAQQSAGSTGSSDAGGDQSLPVHKPPTTYYDASPVGRKSLHDSLAGAFASERTPNVDKKRRDIRLSMTGKTILISLEEFMNRFIPAPPGETEPVEAFKAVDFTGIPQDIESNMYGPLVAAFNREWLLPHDIPASTPHKGDGTVASNQKIDGGLYPRGNAPQDSTSWSSIELSIECKTDTTKQDPFDDRKNNPEASAITRKDVRGQIMCYAVLVFDNQHRVHHFMLLILGAMARLIRWDRSGVLVTHKFDYTKEPEKLTQFLWRFGRMTPAQRGHDPTAVRVLPGSADFRLMHARAATPLKNREGFVVGEHARLMFKGSLKVTIAESIEDSAGKKTYKMVDKDAPFWRLTVHDERGHRDFLVGKPHTTAASLSGRGTRTYVAIDALDKDGPFVYLKDAWRVAHDRIEQEGRILAELNDNSGGGPVVGVPTLLCHGDVATQVTVSQTVWLLKHGDAKPEDCTLKTHRHYRLVVKEVCLSMSEFLSFSELVGLVALCIDAHGQAYAGKNLLHRDISAGNVLICPIEETINGRLKKRRMGILADWELAKRVGGQEAKDTPRQPDRTGTWQFTSASALGNPSKRIIVQDDMESFFHLMLYFAIRFLPHNCENVGEFMDAYFDGYVEANGVYYGGGDKMAAMRSGTLKTLRYNSLIFFEPQQGTQTGHETDCRSNPQNTSPEELSPTDRGAQPATADQKVHPPVPHHINIVFSDFLARLKAHYSLHVPEETTKAGSGQSIARTDTTASAEDDIEDARQSLYLMLTKSAAYKKASKVSSTRPSVHEASASRSDYETRALANGLADHGEMVALFAKHMGKNAGWPKFADRVPDQLPEKYRRGVDTVLGMKRNLESTIDSSVLLTGQGSFSKRARTKE